MICPRCADEKIEVMATSPVKGVWTVYQCQHCLYTWRDTEPLRRTSREHYPEAFRMTQKDIDEAPQVPHGHREAVVLDQVLQTRGQEVAGPRRRLGKVVLDGLAVLVAHEQELLFALALPRERGHVHRRQRRDAAHGQGQQQREQHHASRAR